MITGIVKTRFVDKSYGFISPDIGGNDLFVHRRQVAGDDSLCVGDRVKFAIGINARSGKTEAQRVERIEG